MALNFLLSFGSNTAVANFLQTAPLHIIIQICQASGPGRQMKILPHLRHPENYAKVISEQPLKGRITAAGRIFIVSIPFFSAWHTGVYCSCAAYPQQWSDIG
jgi:hypothetical protein